jgi:4-hydroxybenzoate polyprenyltransferase
MLGLIKTCRIHQWSKNFLIFAALIFSKNLSNEAYLLQTVFAFFSFCLLSSSVYLLNDVIDAEKDRLHPTKRRRPIAAGQVSKGLALVTAVCLAASSVVLAVFIEETKEFSLIIGAYLATNICYSAFLKKVVIADIVTLAIGFLFRIKAGGAVINVSLSPWLILCTFFTAAFLTCCKRRSELSQIEGEPEARKVLADYSFQILDVLIAMTASASMMTYALYTVAEETVQGLGTTGIIYTLPVVLFGMGRYIFLVYRRKAGEDPAADILKDPGVVLAVVLWLAIAFFAVYGGMGEVIGK